MSGKTICFLGVLTAATVLVLAGHGEAVGQALTAVGALGVLILMMLAAAAS